MSRREIKCQKCSEWVEWTGDLYDKCSNCGAYLQEERIRETEAKELKLKLAEEKEAARKAAEHPAVRKTKRVVEFVFMGIVGFVVLLIVLLVG